MSRLIGFAVVRIHRGRVERLIWNAASRRFSWLSVGDPLEQQSRIKTDAFHFGRLRCLDPQKFARIAAEHQAVMRGGTVVPVTK